MAGGCRLLAVLDWAAVGLLPAAGTLLKPAVLLALLAAALAARPGHSGVHGWLVLALCLGLVGDVALSFAPSGHPAGPSEPREALPAPTEPREAWGRAEGALPSEPREATAAPSEPASAVPLVESLRSDTGGLVGTARPAIQAPARAGGAHRAPQPAADSAAPSALFTAGLASFLLGHLCYCAAMLRYGTEQLSMGFGLVLVLLALLAFGHRVLAGAQAQGGTALTVAVAAYITTLGSAVVFGVGTSSLWVAYGIVLFAFSDLVLASDRFVARAAGRHSPSRSATTWPSRCCCSA